MRARQAWHAAMLGMVAVVVASAAAAGDVRPLQPRGARLLEDGMRRSSSLAALVSEIRESDLVVYVDLDPNEPGSLEGSLRFRGAAAGVRYVRVWLQPRRCDAALIAMLAHELQHALEVARATWVSTTDAFRALFGTLGRSTNADHYETDAAQAMGARVRHELEQAPGGRQ